MKIPTQKEVQAAHEKEFFPKKRQDALAKLREQSEKIMTPKTPKSVFGDPSPSKTPRLDALVLKVETLESLLGLLNTMVGAGADASLVLAKTIEDQADQIMRLAMKVELLEQRLPTKEPSNES